MQCNQCGDKTQPETVVRITRSFGGTTALRTQGWYCWNCKTSLCTQAAPVADMRRSSGWGTWLHATLSRMAPPSDSITQRGTWQAAGRYVAS